RGETTGRSVIFWWVSVSLMHSGLLGRRASIAIADTDMKTKQSVTHGPDRSESRTETGPSLRRRNGSHPAPPGRSARLVGPTGRSVRSGTGCASDPVR